MSFTVWPPEINSLLLLDGPGSGPMLEAAAAWEGISSELSSAVNAFGAVTCDLAGQAWQGPSSASMTGAAARYVNWLEGAAAQAEQSAAQARAAATAFEEALSTIVDPGMVTANRSQLRALVSGNLFGQFAPAIAAVEAEYEEMWAHDVSVMGGYHASASATVAQLGQWELALQNLPGEFAGSLAVVEQEIQQLPTTVANGFNHVANTVVGTIFGAPAAPPFAASQTGTYTGGPSLITRFEEAALWPVEPFLAFSGLEPVIENPSSPFLSLFTGTNPLLSPFLSNSPPPLLTLLLGESVQYTTYNGMPVVQITPAHPTGNYVVAMHGGAFLISPSIFHWLDYTVTAYQTGATFEVPIYPLLQQGGTAGTVVPKMAGFVSQLISDHPTSNVSVIGDSAGGNLALASAEYALTNGLHLPSSMVLLSPWLDLSMANPNIALVQDPLLPLGPAQVIGREWAGGLPVHDYRVSPINGQLTGLPPTYVYSGNLDILTPDVLRLQQLAATANAPFNFVLANGQIHDWIILTVDGPQYWPQIDQELGI